MNFDLIENVGLEDEIFLHSREDVGLTYGLTHMNGQHGVGIYADNVLEALVTGGLSVEQVSNMTASGFFA